MALGAELAGLAVGQFAYLSGVHNYAETAGLNFQPGFALGATTKNPAKDLAGWGWGHKRLDPPTQGNLSLSRNP